MEVEANAVREHLPAPWQKLPRSSIGVVIIHFMSGEYFYIDVSLKDLKIVKIGVSKTASLTGDTKDIGVHRAYLTKGQYNKLNKKISKYN